MTDEKLIEKLSDLVREAEKTFEVDENRCIIYPHKLLQKMVITRVLYARQETLEDAWYLFISDIPHADPPGKDGMDGTSQGLLSEYSEKWLEYIKKDREKECPYKDGDIIISYRGVSSELGVFKRQCVDRSRAKVYFTISEKFFYPPSNGESVMYLDGDARLANEEEKKRMVDILAKKGYRWNAEKKELEELPRWRADIGEEYFFLNDRMKIDFTKESGSQADTDRYKINNYFKTHFAATGALLNVWKVLKESQAEQREYQ